MVALVEQLAGDELAFHPPFVEVVQRGIARHAEQELGGFLDPVVAPQPLRLAEDVACVVARRTSGRMIGFAGWTLAVRHPISVATELALLDNLSRGSLDVAVGHGTRVTE